MLSPLWKPRSTELTLGAFWVDSGRAFGWYFPYYGSQKSRGLLFLEKKGPCQECLGCRRNGFYQTTPKRGPIQRHVVSWKKGPARNASLCVRTVIFDIQGCFFGECKNPFGNPPENNSLRNESIIQEKSTPSTTPQTVIRLVKR